MVPAKQPLSAFAVYSKHGQDGSRKQRRRKMKKLRQNMAAASANSFDRAGVKSIKTASERRLEKKTGKKRMVQEAVSISDNSAEGEDNESSRINPPVDSRLTSSENKPEPVPSKRKKRKKMRKNSAVVNSGLSLAEDSLNLQNSSSRRSLASSTPAQRKISSSTEKKTLEPKSSHLLGKKAFQQLLGGAISVDDFMEEYWEKQVAYIAASDRKVFKDLLSTELMDRVFREEVVHFTRDVDITSYTNGVKETHNIDDARAQAHVVWDHYSDGCSVRLLHPHSYSKPLLTLMSTLQEYFGCMVGANSYLTPPESQGFAPHSDDIEAFILQLEGKKHWKVYKPREMKEVLPRYSSPNYSQSDLFEGPVFDGILSPGDILYFPRGFIHQGSTLPGTHSLHVTLSVYQKSAWVDLMEKVLPKALQLAAANDVKFRKGLPIGYLSQAGRFTNCCKATRKKLLDSVTELTSKLVSYIDIDSAIDEMGVRFMHDALPPILTSDEKACSVFENGFRMHKNGQLENKVDHLPSSTKIRIARATSCRLVGEQVIDEGGNPSQQMRLYYTSENSILYHGEEPNFFEIEPEYLVPLWTLIKAYPKFISISDLITQSEDEEVVNRLILDLWYLGIIITNSPLEPTDSSPELSAQITNGTDSSVESGSNKSDDSDQNISSTVQSNGSNVSIDEYFINSKHWITKSHNTEMNDSSDDDDWNTEDHISSEDSADEERGSESVEDWEDLTA